MLQFCGFFSVTHSSGNLDNFRIKSGGKKLEERRKRERERDRGIEREKKNTKTTESAQKKTLL